MSGSAWKVGDLVKWSSQSAGSRKEKVGRVEKVIPPRCSSGIPGAGMSRDHESYAVRVGRRLYWPRVSLLCAVETTREDAMRAAARDLFDALAEYVAAGKDFGKIDRAETRARAALAKASGGEK